MRPFLLERWFARHEFSTPHMLSASDCETLSMAELLRRAGVDAAELLETRLGYTESRGAPLLRQRIAACYGAAIGPDQVLVTSAPEEGIYLALRTLIEPGDRVVVLTPCYQSLAEVARDRGAEVLEWAVRETASGWQLDLEALPGLFGRRPRLLVVNFPHNPTGLLPDAATWQQLLGLAAEAGVRIFSDEMYRGLEPDPARRLPSAVEVLPDAVSLWGLSKSFGLPGLRCGWLVSRDQGALDRLSAYRDYTTICSPAPAEVLATVALGLAEDLMAENRLRIAGNSVLVTALMARHPETLSWKAPQAGPVALARVVTGSAARLSERVRLEAGVLVAPSTLFGFGDRHLRIGLGRAGFASALAAFEGWLERQTS